MKTLTLQHLPRLLVILCLTLIATPLRAAPPLDPVAFRNRIHKLWSAHANWTRLYLVAAVADLPCKEAAADRLIQNQLDIGNAIKPFYGKEAGDKLAELLKEHIFNVMEYIHAAKAKDWDSQEDANDRWNSNADDIAAFFSKTNPKWTYAAMKSLWHTQVNFTIHEVSAHVKQHWKEDIAAYDKVHEQTLAIAEMLCDGILQQFPARFESLSDVEDDLSGS